MYVCICNAITDSDIRNAADAGAESLGDLHDELGVASNCGSCVELAESILATHLDKNDTPHYVAQPADSSGAYLYQPVNAQ